MPEPVLRVCALYPELMNIYADRGNLIMLEKRCAWRGIGFELSGRTLGEPLDPGAADLLYIGGGQDRDQRLCALDLAEEKREAVHAAVAAGVMVLAVCGGYQLLGTSYVMGDEELPGVGLVPLRTVREDGPRLIGNVAIEVDLDSDPAAPGGIGGAGGHRVLAGFENHGGRTHLDPGATPLGRVLKGHGNNGGDGFEGVRGGPEGNVIGTYLHGPLLPKNAWFADWLIARSLRLRGLAPLDDAFEDAAHAEARAAAGVG